MMTKKQLTALLIVSVVSTLLTTEASATSDEGGSWIRHSEQLNGDVYFYDSSRVETTDDLRRVWNRIRYKTSVMGASSFQSLLEIDCSEKTEKVLQSTFFSDDSWESPAMMTDKNEKPKVAIVAGSAAERLVEILCE